MTNEMLKTIKGKARYCYLSAPDTAFGKDDYHVTLEISKEDAQEHKTAIQDIIKYQIAEEHKARPNQTGLIKRAPLPYKDEGETFTFKIHSKFKPKVWSKDQKEIEPDVSIWKDSSMWVNYKAQGYNKSIGVGCTLYIQGIQIDNLVQGSTGPNGQCPFPKREEVTL